MSAKLNFHVIAVGKLKSNSPFSKMLDEYSKRLTGKIKFTEINTASQKEECQNILKKLDRALPLIALDEKGKSFSSIEFSKKIEQLSLSGTIQIVIGGADGLSQDIRDQADIITNFGRLTWPHMMVRVMLVEQLYRAQQILANHPYHRE